MMGLKERAFGPLPPVSLDDLVPPDHFYRHLERSLDLAFVRDLVRDTYADIGRPSIDPVVFFKLQLILFFEGLRSERQLLRVVADRLSLRWYLGYDLTEPLPDHSSLTRLRDRYGLAVFRRFFEQIVEQCIGTGLVWGEERSIDATKVAANASLESVGPRFAVAAHPSRLFAGEPAGNGDGGTREAEADEPVPPALPVALTDEARLPCRARRGPPRPDRGGRSPRRRSRSTSRRSTSRGGRGSAGSSTPAGSPATPRSGTVEHIAAVEDQQMRASVPLSAVGQRPGRFPIHAFA